MKLNYVNSKKATAFTLEEGRRLQLLQSFTAGTRIVYCIRQDKPNRGHRCLEAVVYQTVKFNFFFSCGTLQRGLEF